MQENTVRLNFNHRSLWKDMATFWSESKFLDLELKCGLDGKFQSVLCHKLVFASLSSVIRKSLLSDGQQDLDHVSQICLPDLRFKDMQRFVQDVYGSMKVDEDKFQFSVPSSIWNTLGIQSSLADSSDDYEMSEESMLKVEIKEEETDVSTIVEPDFHGKTFYGQSDFSWPLERSNYEADEVGLGSHERKTGRKKLKSQAAKKPATRRVTPGKIYNCNECDEQFPDYNLVRYHLIKVHRPDAKVMVCCRSCKKELNLREFLKHFKKVHQLHQCATCGVRDIHSRLVEHHRRKHKIMKCEVCGVECTGKSKYDEHRDLVHRNKFYCEICGKTYGRIKYLYRHKVMAHKNEKDLPHHCEYCGKGFYALVKLQSHVATNHTKDRPFKCRFNCGAAYNDASNRVGHERNKHGMTFFKYAQHKSSTTSTTAT